MLGCHSSTETIVIMDILQALEASGFSMWVKESSTAYVAVLAFHTIGLAFLVGVSTATALRILGVARSMPIAPMEDFFPLMYAGFWLNALTGSVLVCLYPSDFLLDPTIYIKLAAVGGAMFIIHRLREYVFDAGEALEAHAASHHAKTLATLLLMFWVTATVAGRVMAYSMPTKLQTAAAVLVLIGTAIAIGVPIRRKLPWLQPAPAGEQGDANV